MDWGELERIMSGIYAGKTGRPSYPLLTLLRASLLGIWYRLSDVELAQTLFRDLLFRKFCHLELGGDVPDATTIGRFRAKLIEHDLWEVLLGEVNRQLEAKHIIMTEGRINIIDATPVEAAQSGPGKDVDGQPKRDPEAGWPPSQPLLCNGLPGNGQGRQPRHPKIHLWLFNPHRRG